MQNISITDHNQPETDRQVFRDSLRFLPFVTSDCASASWINIIWVIVHLSSNNTLKFSCDTTDTSPKKLNWAPPQNEVSIFSFCRLALWRLAAVCNFSFLTGMTATFTPALATMRFRPMRSRWHFLSFKEMRDTFGVFFECTFVGSTIWVCFLIFLRWKNAKLNLNPWQPLAHVHEKISQQHKNKFDTSNSEWCALLIGSKPLFVDDCGNVKIICNHQRGQIPCN